MKQNHSKPAVYGFGPNFDEIDWGSDNKPDLFNPCDLKLVDPPYGQRSYQEKIRQVFCDLFDLANKGVK